MAAHARLGLATTSTYDDDGPAARAGADRLGAAPRPVDLEALVDDPAVWLVHTHERPGADHWPAIVLVRDGRDALVSRAHQVVEMGWHETFRVALDWLITRPLKPDNPSSGTWGGNVLAWLGRSSAASFVRFEDLVDRPDEVVDGALAAAGVVVAAGGAGAVPGFAELHAHDPGFFRRGVVGSYLDEMPDDLHDRFWSVDDNAEAMRRLGYG